MRKSARGAACAGTVAAATSITVHVPRSIRKRGGRKVILTPDGSRIDPALASRTVPCRADPALVKALARAHRWKRMLDDGRYASISDIARAEKIDRGYVGAVLRLTLLAPDIAEGILDGRQVARLGLSELMEPFPVAWDEQRVSHWTDFGTGRCEAPQNAPSARCGTP